MHTRRYLRTSLFVRFYDRFVGDVVRYVDHGRHRVDDGISLLLGDLFRRVHRLREHFIVRFLHNNLKITVELKVPLLP